MQLYPLQHYTESGNLKPPIYFYLAILFLTRTWGLLAISIISRETGHKLLAIFYPDKIHFYLGLISGLLAVLLFLLSGRDHDKYRVISKLWQCGYPVLLLSLLGDFSLQIYYLTQLHYQYSFSASLQLVMIIWFILYSLQSKHLKACFKRHN